jgi:5-methylthioadenosine/S-adenosylhomocysteine deaminase
MNDMYDIVIEGGALLTMEPREGIIDNGSIGIAGSRIAKIVAPSSDRPPELAGKITISARGKVVLPGLINGHTHLFQTLLRGCFAGLPLTPWLRKIYAVGNHLSKDDYAVGARLGCLESLRSGVTTIVEHAFLHPTPTHVDAAISVLRESGIRGVLCRAAMDTGELVPDAMKETIGNIVKEWERLIGAYQDQKEAMISIMVGPNTPGINATSDLVVAAKEFAHAHGLRWNPHVAESQDINARVKERYGQSGVVEYFHALGVLGPNLVGAHCVRLSEREVELFAGAKSSAVYNPVSNMFLGDGIAPVEELRRRGATVCLGTDGATSNTSQDMFEVMKAGSLLQKIRYGAAALPAAETLKMATLNGAQALGLEEKIGSIREGKLADLIIVSLRDKPHAVAVHDLPESIVYSAKSTDVETVIVNGRLVIEEGEVKTFDDRAVMEEAQTVGERLARRCAS